MKEHDTIVLKHDVPEYGLEAGDIGTIVHRYKSPDTYEVESCVMVNDKYLYANIWYV